MGKLKLPKPQSGKHIQLPTIAAISSNKLRPIFALEFLQKGYCIADCDKDHKAAFADALRERSQLTWEDIQKAHRHGLGHEKIPRDRIKGPIPTAITEDVEDFLAFRFFGKAPMVGFRRDATFFVVWLDRNFSLYEHE